MARRRRPGSRTSVTDGRAEIIVPIESIVTADDESVEFNRLTRWLRRVDSYPIEPALTDRVSVVIDRFAFDIHFADVAHATDTHDGDAFLDAAINNGTVAVYVTRDLDPRRSTPADLQAVAQTGDLLAGDVPAFQIDLLPD